MDNNSQSLQYSVVLVGCGKMGSAMLEAWLGADLIKSALVIDPGGLPEKFQNNSRITHAKDAPASLAEQPDIVVLATKPQTLKDAARTFYGTIAHDSLILSIAAGQSLSTLQSLFRPGQTIVRTMPNTPASIGKGMSVAIANDTVTPPQKDMISCLLGATGRIEWVMDENLMDAVTALSGSGPAYIFLLIEIMAEAGKKLGLEPEMAMTLARQTVIGSAALAEADKSIPAAALRQNVTSPGGTTEAALQILMNGELQDLFDQALQKAKARAKELNA